MAKILSISLNNGSEISILTSMPESEITKEIFGTDAPTEWALFEGRANDDLDAERVPVYVLRHMIASFMIKPFQPAKVATRRPGLVQ